jgi:hypothetical protein
VPKQQQSSPLLIIVLVILILLVSGFTYLFVTTDDSSSILPSITIMSPERDANTSQEQEAQLETATQEDSEELDSTSDTETAVTTTEEEPEAPRELPQGKIGFTVSSGQQAGPKFNRGFIDPYDPKVGQTQTFNIAASSNSSISNISVTIVDDEGETTHQLSRISGTDQEGTWEGTWTNQNTHEKTYKAIIKGTDAAGTVTVEIILR